MEGKYDNKSSSGVYVQLNKMQPTETAGDAARENGHQLSPTPKEVASINE